MTTAKQILEMIEQVSPDDVAGLDEIDALVYAYLKLHDGFKVSVHKGGRSITYRHNSWDQEHPSVLLHLFDGHRVTRSRDALKAIRPEGWWFRMGTDPNKDYMAGLYNGKLGNDGHATDEHPLPTEELAELHAIIQAIEYERNNK